MDEPIAADSTTPSSDGLEEVNWSDPGIPVGNAPPLPKWPLYAFGLAWLGWVVFLAAMLISRTDSDVIRSVAGS